MIAPFVAAVIVDRLAAVPVMYWLLWFASVVVSIALVIVLRTRWGQSRPLQKCAVLSLLVHTLLAFLAMTIHVVVGDGGGGSGRPIRVRLVEDSGADISATHIPVESAAESEIPPPLFVPPESEPESIPDAAAEATERKLQTEPPPLLAPAPNVVDMPKELARPETNENADLAETETEEVIEAPEVSTKEEPRALSETAKVVAPANDDRTQANSIPDAGHNENQQPLTGPSTIATHDVAKSARPVAPPADVAPSIGSPEAASAASAPYALRSDPGRLGLVELQGGNVQTEAAVAAALAWLARVQSADGRWDANRLGAGQEQTVLGHDRGGAGRNADTGISALALLAFLGAGHSHQQGDYQDTVHRGLEFLIGSQAIDGNLFGQSTFYAQMYCHSMATFALAEAQAMTGDARLKTAVHKAVGFCVRAQNPATGGWRYRPTYDTGDTSQLGWQMMALASAQRAGAEVPPHTWTRMGRFLKSVRRGNYGGLASYRPDGPASTSMTAEAFYCQLLLHDIAGSVLDEQAADEATNQMLASLPNAERMNFYYWYYATLALQKRQHATEPAATAWLRWNEALTTSLIDTQVNDGPDAGSWNTNTVWGGYGGRVYTTAMAAMCLEAYYRYAPSQAEHLIATPMNSDAPVR